MIQVPSHQGQCFAVAMAAGFVVELVVAMAVKFVVEVVVGLDLVDTEEIVDLHCQSEALNLCNESDFYRAALVWMMALSNLDSDNVAEEQFEHLA